MQTLIEQWAEKISGLLGLGRVKVHLEGGSISFASPETNEIFIGKRQVRTTRDIIFLLGHEMTHLRQWRENPSILSIGVRPDYRAPLGMKPHEYRALPREQEADKVGLELTRTLNYKNKVLNKDGYSIFVHCMEYAPK